MAKAEVIHGDRRADRRYRYEMAVRFSCPGQSETCNGVGFTQDLSGGGIRFLTDTPPPTGAEIELRVSWPFLLQNVCPMELLVWGVVLRTGPTGCVVRMWKHEFRTCGTRSFDTLDATNAVAAGCNFDA